MKNSLTMDGFDSLLDYEYIKSDKQSALLVCSIQNKHKNIYNYVHGGVYYSLSDAACGFVVSELDGKWVTLSGNINYIRGFQDGNLFVDARLISKSNKTCVIDVYTRDENGTIYTKGTYTMYNIDK